MNNSIEEKYFGVSYSTEALFGADIPIPNINEIVGKTKFIKRSNDKSVLNLGYRVSVSQEKLDKAKIPTKYLRQKSVVIEGHSVTQEPIEEVTYEIIFSFTLKDKDGFKLLVVSSDPETITSGKKNEFQGITQQSIPIDLASRVARIELSTQLTKCISCE